MFDINVKKKLDPKDEERKFIVEWIRLYRELTALWKIKSDEYKNRKKKNAAYEILVGKYRERYPEADREAVKKKLNSLRTNFRKELKKIADSRKFGDEEGYVTKLWYFKDMEFLMDQDQENQDSLWQNEKRAPAVVPVKKKKKPNSKENLAAIYGQYSQSENEYERLARVWASEFQKVNENQRLFAKKAITDILFEGQMGTLHRNSVVINGMRPQCTLHTVKNIGTAVD